MDALPDDIILVFIHALQDSRRFALTCTRVYQLYTMTPDWSVFTRRKYGLTPSIAPPKLYSLFLPSGLYLAGNLPCLQELWRNSIRVKSHFIESIFAGVSMQEEQPLPNGAATAEWLWDTFQSEFVKGGNGWHTDEIVRAGHTELLRKVVDVVETISVDNDIIDEITDFGLFRLVYDNVDDETRECVSVSSDTPTYIVTYLSMRGEELAYYKQGLYSFDIDYIRALRLDDVLKNYNGLMLSARGDVRDWLVALKDRVNG